MRNLQSHAWPNSPVKREGSSKVDRTIAHFDVQMMAEEPMLDEKLVTSLSRALGIASLCAGILALVGLATPFL